jgi:prephenate dehydrogenase
MSAAEHDHVMAFLSHLPQIGASALMHVVGRAIGEERLSLAGAGLRDTTRLSSSPARVWKPVLASNADEIGAALDAFIGVLADLRARLKDDAVVEDVFESARQWKQQLTDLK